MSDPKFLVTYSIGRTRMAATFDSNFRMLDEFDPSGPDVAAMIARAERTGSVDASIWDEAFGSLDIVGRENAVAYRLIP